MGAMEFVEHEAIATPARGTFTPGELAAIRRRNQARRDFISGQFDGLLMSIHLCHEVKRPGPVDIESLLPALASKSHHYKSGLKAALFEKTFPLAIRLFYDSRRSRRERLRFMDDILERLRG